MEPGKARKVPVPMRFRIRDAQNAMRTPHQGPRSTAARTFTMCWMGKHFEAPTGIENPDRHTVRAQSMADTASFFVLFICFTPPHKVMFKNDALRKAVR